VEQTVYLWLRQERIDRGEQEGLSSDEREELAQLRREVKRLSTERELLKRAVAFWVKETDR
jgi:transposase